MELWEAVVHVLVREPELYITDRILRVEELATEGTVPPRDGEQIHDLFSLFTSGMSPCWQCGKSDLCTVWHEDARQYLHERCEPVRQSSRRNPSMEPSVA